MLYKYNGKIYIKPFANKIIEVKVTNKNGDYTVEPTERVLELTKEVESELVSIPLEEAAKPVKGSSKTTTTKNTLKDFDINL